MTFIELQNSPIELESSLIQLESSVIELESFQFNKRALIMCTVRDHANSLSAFCNWNRELSYSIKELSNTGNTCDIEQWWIRELSNSITELSNSFQDKLN